MVLLRRTLLFVLLFSFCLTVCVLPVSAASINPVCVLNLQPETFGIREYSLSDPRWAYSSIPASFSYEYDDSTNYYTWEWVQYTALTDPLGYLTAANKKIEIIVTVGNGAENLRVDLNNFSFDFYFISDRTIYYYFPLNGYVEVVSDTGEIVYSSSLEEFYQFPVLDNLSFDCSEWFSVTYYSLEEFEISISERISTLDLFAKSNMKIAVESVPVSLDSISIQISDLKDSVDNIGSSVGDIKATVENIQEGVVEINGTVTDMKEQLEDSSSPIWSAAGDKISEALTDLFVPDPQQIADVKQGFDNLAKDKLGGAYTAMETVDDTVENVSKKLHNPNSHVSIEFPGISVPLGGDIGTVQLADSQDVILPTQITAILHPVAGTIFSFICGFGTLNVLKDMVECFLSGYSYAAYLHRNKGGSDE